MEIHVPEISELNLWTRNAKNSKECLMQILHLSCPYSSQVASTNRIKPTKARWKEDTKGTLSLNSMIVFF